MSEGTTSQKSIFQFDREVREATAEWNKVITIDDPFMPQTVLTTITARFGDFFAPPTDGKQHVLVIPHYTDGALYRAYKRKSALNGLSDIYVAPEGAPASNTEAIEEAKKQISQGFDSIFGVMAVKSVLKGIPRVVLISYEDRDIGKWNELFQDICRLLPSPDPEVEVVLIVPAIGANNELPFVKSAFAIFHGIRTYLRDRAAKNKPKQIHLVTLFTTAELASTRVIFHFVRLMESDKKDQKDKPCKCCLALPAEWIFSTCGHRVVCRECCQQLQKKECPLCNTPFTPNDLIHCPIVVDYSRVRTGFHCCLDMYQRANQVFTPCGCFKCVCTTCADKFNESLATQTGVLCPACKAPCDPMKLLLFIE